VIEVAFALVLLVGAGGAGRFVLRRLDCRFETKTEEWCFAITVGLGQLVVMTLALGLAGALYAPLLCALIGLWAVWGGKELVPMVSVLKQRFLAVRPTWNSVHTWLGIVAAVGMLLNLVRALAPPHGATDPLAYQLALPKIFLANHGLSFEPTLTGALYPSNMGLLYIIALALRNGILAQVLHWLMGVLSCVAVFGFGRRHFSVGAGVWAAVLFSFFPVLVVFSPKGYIDVGLCFFQFMAFWALANWLADAGRRRSLLLAALLTGLAMGTKHQGLSTPLFGVAILVGGGLYSRRGFKAVGLDLLLYLGIALVLVLPWYLRAYAYAGNPIWPLANGVFGGLPYGHKHVLLTNISENGVAGAWWTALIPSVKWIQAYWHSISPWEWTFRPSGWQKAIGIYFVALLPGILLYGRDRKMALLMGGCLAYYLVLVRVLHANPRYGMVLFAFLSLACGHVAARMWRHRFRPMAYIFAGGLAVSFCLNLIWQYSEALPVWRVAFGIESREHFLQEHEYNYRIFRYVNRNLPEDSTVLLQGMVKGFYCKRDYLWDHPYQRIINYVDYKTPEELLGRMQQLGISHIVRMIKIPQSRLVFYPQYFLDPYHEAFRQKYLKLLHHDKAFALFEVRYPS
jgi:hypothetical protein